MPFVSQGGQQTHRPVVGASAYHGSDPEILDSFYAELRRCRDHCRHSAAGHVCRPLRPATVRKIHYLLSGAYHRRCGGAGLTEPHPDADVLGEAQRARHLPQAERQRVMRRLRAELHRIHRRDYFPPPQRKAAERAVNALHPQRHSDDEEIA